MCREVTAYIDELIRENGGNFDAARRKFNSLIDTDPYFISELKGLSIARAVLGAINKRRAPEYPTLIAAQESEENPAWRLTLGFLKGMQVATIEEIPTADSLELMHVHAELEPVSAWDPRTARERSFDPEDISYPAVRVHFSL